MGQILKYKYILPYKSDLAKIYYTDLNSYVGIFCIPNFYFRL